MYSDKDVDLRNESNDDNDYQDDHDDHDDHDDEADAEVNQSYNDNVNGNDAAVNDFNDDDNEENGESINASMRRAPNTRRRSTRTKRVSSWGISDVSDRGKDNLGGHKVLNKVTVAMPMLLHHQS